METGKRGETEIPGRGRGDEESTEARSEPAVVTILAAGVTSTDSGERTEFSPSPSWRSQRSLARSLRRGWRTPVGVIVLLVTALVVFHGIRTSLRPVPPVGPEPASVARNVGSTPSAPDPKTGTPTAEEPRTVPVVPDRVRRNLRPVDDFGVPVEGVVLSAGNQIEDESGELVPDERFREGGAGSDTMVPLPTPGAFAAASGQDVSGQIVMEPIIAEPGPALPVLPGTPVLPEYEKEIRTETNRSPGDIVYPDTGYAVIRLIPEDAPVRPQIGFDEVDVRP
ncbi:MAG: hypothetical protein Q4C47_05120 [Planctomycetia bacterium]|nr:hypothetical protein [Planctomycetia bacterium]